MPAALRFGLVAFAAGLALRAAEPAAAPTPAISSDDLQFFETKIRPLLADKCYSCHSHQADKVKSGLMLDTREGLMTGGDTGPAIVPGKPEDSLLIDAIRYQDEDLQMPPEKAGGKLTDRQIADLTEWVRRGAPDPRTLVAKGSSSAYGGVGKAHWSFQPVQKPAVPQVQNAAWCKNPIDNFVLAKLEASGMTPNTPADKTTLIRRVYYDLVGLPPTVRDVQEFVNDSSPDAYEKIVDRLLATPQYGEHWARYWLDVARYSDTKGDPPKQDDPRYPDAWTYRDWVIAAFNSDLPYNQFVVEQLAGDYVWREMEAVAEKKKQPVPEMRWPLAAMGFLTLGNQFDGRRDDIIADQIDVTTKAFLGLTVACARCHDHKFDPIPQKDYYSLYGVFANCQQPATLPTLQRDPPKTSELEEYLKKSAELQQRERDLDQEQIALRREARRTRTRPDREKAKELRKQEQQVHRALGDLETSDPGAPARANALYDVPRSHDYPVLLRGEPQHRGEIVPRRAPGIISPTILHTVAAGESLASIAKKYGMKADDVLQSNRDVLKKASEVKPGMTLRIVKRPEWHSGSGRAQLALAIADPKNPLTARVIVNRIWQQHWGQGFVITPDDLGNMSSPPTHPELLDWLAATFVENGWSLKSLHRMIVLSAAYRQSGTNNPKFAELDPNNKLLWRYNLRRFTFEELHDSLLAIAGELDLKGGGRPVPISSSDFAKRRAIYTMIDRRNPPELLTQFDFPSPDVESGRRYETLVPQQALFLMNSPMVIETARKLVDRPAFAEIKSDADRVAALYLAIYQRMPTKQEVALGLRYVKANPTGTSVDLAETTSSAETRPLTPREQRLAARQAAKQKRGPGRFATQVGGVYDKRAPLDAWTKLAHALFQSNEAMFYN